MSKNFRNPEENQPTNTFVYFISPMLQKWFENLEEADVTQMILLKGDLTLLVQKKKKKMLFSRLFWMPEVCRICPWNDFVFKLFTKFRSFVRNRASTEKQIVCFSSRLFPVNHLFQYAVQHTITTHQPIIGKLAEFER